MLLMLMKHFIVCIVECVYLHEETCQQGSLNVEGVASGTEGGH